MKLREYFHYVEYDAHIKGTKNDVDCPVVRAGESIPQKDWDCEIDRWGGSGGRQEIYLAGSDQPDKPDYIITQHLTIGEFGGEEHLEEWETGG